MGNQFELKLCFGISIPLEDVWNLLKLKENWGEIFDLLKNTNSTLKDCGVPISVELGRKRFVNTYKYHNTDVKCYHLFIGIIKDNDDQFWFPDPMKQKNLETEVSRCLKYMKLDSVVDLKHIQPVISCFIEGTENTC